MRVAELLHCARCDGGFRLGLVRVGGAPDQPARLDLAEMQHDVGRHLIGSVFLASKHWDLQHIEQGVGEFMQAGVEQGSQQSVDRRDTSRCPLEGMSFQSWSMYS